MPCSWVMLRQIIRNMHVVIVEHGGGGSSVAAPMASKILKEAVMLDPTKEAVDSRQ